MQQPGMQHTVRVKIEPPGPLDDAQRMHMTHQRTVAEDLSHAEDTQASSPATDDSGNGAAPPATAAAAQHLTRQTTVGGDTLQTNDAQNARDDGGDGATPPEQQQKTHSAPTSGRTTNGGGNAVKDASPHSAHNMAPAGSPAPTDQQHYPVRGSDVHVACTQQDVPVHGSDSEAVGAQHQTHSAAPASKGTTNGNITHDSDWDAAFQVLSMKRKDEEGLKKEIHNLKKQLEDSCCVLREKASQVQALEKQDQEKGRLVQELLAENARLREENETQRCELREKTSQVQALAKQVEHKEHLTANFLEEFFLKKC